MTARRLVLFDIDGTLLWPDGAGRASMKIALEAVYGTAGDIDSYQFAGHTDRETVAALMSRAGIMDEVIWERFGEVGVQMGEVLARLVGERRHNIRSCPGALALVSRLAAHKDVLMGLLTGNMPQTAPIKLKAAGFDPALFRVGAFGDESKTRADLPASAVRRAMDSTGVDYRGGQVVIIGDTPADITCGREVGARSIAVATGWTPREALARLGPAALFDDLADTAAVLEVIFAQVEEDADP